MEPLSLPFFLMRFLSLPRFLLSLTIFISWIASSSCVDVCEPFICVDHVFEYPFGHKNSSCGDPALQLECDHDMPVLNISGNNYYILQPLSYWKGNPNHRMTIIDKRLRRQNICSQWLFTLDIHFHIQLQFCPDNQFHILGEYRYITLGAKCKEMTELTEVAPKLGCNDDWYNDWRLFSNLSLATKHCQLLGQVPVRTSDIPALWSNPKQITEKGLDIEWSLSKSCEGCESRKGIRAYDSTTLNFTQCTATGPGEHTNITLGRKCKEMTELTEAAPKLGCDDDWYHDWHLFSNLSLATKYCELLVQVPVRTSEIPAIWSNPKQITEKGFDIEWNLSKSCEDCESRKGICAYNSTMDFTRKNKIAIPLGCSIGGVALVATVVLLFIFYVKRKKPTSSRCLLGDFGCSQRNDREIEYLTSNLSIFRYDELEQATNIFHEDNELGDGGFGSVFLGKLRDGRTAAIKRLYQENPRRVEQFMNEIQILSSLNHPNLVRLYGCTDPQSPVLLLVYEFIPNGTLADHLHGSRRTPKGLAWETRLNIAIETAQALAFLHSVQPPVFHRDVKSSNILLDENFRAKVADFGLSRSVPPNVSHVTTAPQGTPGYVDPEYHQCFQLTDKSDVYSFGVVLVEIISAKVAVDVNRNRNEISLANMALDKIKRAALHELVDPELKSETNHEVKAMVDAVGELAYQCLARERDCRPDMKEVTARLEDIKQRYGISTREQQKSLRIESGDLKGVVPSLSPTSVEAE